MISNQNMTNDVTTEKLAKIIKELPYSEDAKKLYDWYVEYISLFRKEYEKLSDEEKKCVSNAKNFLYPCQIEIIWIKNPSHQIIIQSNFKDRSDEEILIHGPYETHVVLEKIKTILMEPWWQKKIERPTAISHYYTLDTYAEELADTLYHFIESVKMQQFQPKSSNDYSSGHSLSDFKIWVQQFNGNIANLEVKREVDQIIAEIKNAYNIKKEYEKTPPAVAPEIKYDGFGIHLFPPILLGKKPRPTLEQLLHGVSYDFSLSEKVLDDQINGHVIILNKDDISL